MIDKRDIPIILGLFFVAFLIRVLGVADVCMYGDEALYLNKTFVILANNWAPTAKILEHANPFLSYIGAGATLLIEGKLNVLRMISVAFGSLTIPMLYLFGTAMYDRKTGIISAILLCFLAYHCLFSRLFMLEALTLFFIIAFLYFFWLSQCSGNRKSTTYAIIAGAMMGLAFDAKYISLFLVPAVLIYVLWTRRFSFRALLDKRLILIFIFALLFFSPLLISLYTTGVGLDPIFFHVIERFEKQSIANVRVVDYSPSEMIISGGENMLGVLARGAWILVPTWANLFLLSAILLFLITLLSYLPDFITREKRGSFLMISFSTLYIILLGCARHQYYLLFSIPFYFVMLSHFSVTSIEHLRRENSYKNIFRIFIILLMAIMLFSSLITGATSPYWEEGDYLWTKNAEEYIKTDIAKSGYENHFLIGITTYLKEPVDYPAYLSGLNASTIRILKPAGEYSGERACIDLEKINIVKPLYIVTSEPLYNYYFTENVKKEIFKDYKIVFHSQTVSYIKAYTLLLHSDQDCLVLKRKNMQPPEFSQIDGKDGKISQDIFKRSVPGVMKVGKIYVALVQVRNTGDSRTNFTVNVYSDRYTIFVQEDSSNRITLDKDSIRILKFKIIPLCEYVGELPITVDLFVNYDENERYIKRVDSFSDYVYLIEK
jgi:4-amino-4-deoxy-L-arabinose transferase-like glycosyltransferase